MKLRIAYPSASSLIRLGMTARIVYAAAIDLPRLGNGGWLCILLGALLALPLALAVGQLLRSPGTITPGLLRPASAVIGAITVWDAATVASGIAISASYVALNSVPLSYLLIPQFLLCLWCLHLNGNAIGGSAGIWNRLLPWLILIVAILQVRDYRPAWLTPILGPGASGILDGAVRVAGWLSLPTGLYLVAEPDEREAVSPWMPAKNLLHAAVFAAFICLMSGMMTPFSISSLAETKFFRLNALLTNGRSALSLQLPTIALWFVGLSFSMLLDVFSAAILLQTALPSMDGRACAWIVLIAAMVFTGIPGDPAAFRWLYPALGILLAGLMLSAQWIRGKDVKANA